MGLIRFNYLDKPHRIFFYYILVVFLIQCIHIYVSEIQIKNIFQYLFNGLSFFLLFRMLSAWSNIQSRKPLMLIGVISPFLFVLEYWIRYEEEIKHPSYSQMLISLLFSLFATSVLFQKITSFDSNPWKSSVFLILVPMILFFLLFDALQLVYLSVYNPNTHLLMRQSFVVYRILFPFSFIAYTFALLWSPRREIFI